MANCSGASFHKCTIINQLYSLFRDYDFGYKTFSKGHVVYDDSLFTTRNYSVAQLPFEEVRCGGGGSIEHII
jgi:hypothetical protein